MLKGLKSKLNMKNNNLKIDQNNDGSFTVEWDKQDPEWKWMNDLTSKEIQVMIEQAVKLDNEQRL